MTRGTCGAIAVWLILLKWADGGEVTIDLGQLESVSLVGAIQRWDAAGNPRRPVDPKARIDKPFVDVQAVRESARQWAFHNLPAGRYDLVVLTSDRKRIEGCSFPPVLEFDPFFTVSQAIPEAVRVKLEKEIAGARHYENKVTPLFFVGNDRQVRVFLRLLRDLPTSFDGDAGQPVATVRHEVWQFSWQYGAWSKDKRTRVFDRHLLGVTEWRQWTWNWASELGNLEVTDQPMHVVLKSAAGQ